MKKEPTNEITRWILALSRLAHLWASWSLRLTDRLPLPGARPSLIWALLCVAPRFAMGVDFLPPDQAFRLTADRVDSHTVAIRFEIEDGYYMYRERFAFSSNSNNVRLLAPAYPTPERKFDETFDKDVDIYRKGVNITLPFDEGGAPGDWVLRVTSQGCADAGICYPPQQHDVPISPLTSEHPPVINQNVTTVAQHTPPIETSELELSSVPDASARIDRALSSRSLMLVVSLFFGMGVLLALTPCVLPMVPILSVIVVGTEARRWRSLALSAAYVLGMSVIYTGVGVTAGIIGESLTAYLQAPWVLASFAVLLSVLALAMFGVYEFQLPQSWLTRLQASSGKLHGGHFISAAVMGAMSALIVGPCVTAPLAGALAYIARSGDAVIGGSALFAMALGMGTPLLLVGAGAGVLLPRTGQWMVHTKTASGYMLLALALWMANPIMPSWMFMLAVATLLLAVGVALGALTPFQGSAPLAAVKKAVGILAISFGVVLILGVSSGGRDVLQPLGKLTIISGAAANSDAIGPHQSDLHFESVQSVDELEARLAQAAGDHRPVMLDFYADWCTSCKEMERFTFADSSVKNKLQRFVLLRADVTANSQEDRELLRRFGIFGPPSAIFYDADGKLKAERVVGYKSASAFLSTLQRIYPS
ncbi:protein-disulfide reductase DsbD [Cupriavidus sp. 2SB]|uniref:protein-disulfide reductase DsbD n=1 Tax=Cupriavidus sp. 2SB TaxID=2502199 RepID=UPI0010F85CCA|nr:protein-disulfide reductase DsbD [Cupriavidus sp. 2SB]